MLIEIESDFQLFSPFQQANILVNGLRVFAAEMNWNIVLKWVYVVVGQNYRYGYRSLPTPALIAYLLIDNQKLCKPLFF